MVGADVVEGSSVTEVGVDTGELVAVDCGDTLDVDVALALAGAVAAGAVELAVVLDVEVDDVLKVLVSSGRAKLSGLLVKIRYLPPCRSRCAG